jgi:hypothetical protein
MAEVAGAERDRVEFNHGLKLLYEAPFFGRSRRRSGDDSAVGQDGETDLIRLLSDECSNSVGGYRHPLMVVTAIGNS